MPISEAHCTGNLLAWLRHAGHEGPALLRRVPSVHLFVLRQAPMGFALHHPWRRSKSAADILVLAPNRAERCSSNSGLAPGPAALARRPASRPGQAGSPRRTTGGKPEPSAPRPVNSNLSIRGKDRAGCYLGANPSPTHGEIKLSHLCNRLHQDACIGEKIMVSTTVSGTHPYRETVLY